MTANNVIVCGGAFSLISDIKKAPKGILISTNHHAAQMLDCDYICTLHPENKILSWLIRYFDIENIETRGLKKVGYTGMIGISFAIQKLNADRIYLAGYDLYTGPYCHEQILFSKGKSRHPFHVHEEHWKAYFRLLGEDVHRIIPLSGPLIDIIAQFEQPAAGDRA